MATCFCCATRWLRCGVVVHVTVDQAFFNKLGFELVPQFCETTALGE
jgi:hypothetical protein